MATANTFSTLTVFPLFSSTASHGAVSDSCPLHGQRCHISIAEAFMFLQKPPSLPYCPVLLATTHFHVLGTFPVKGLTCKLYTFSE